MIRSIVRGVACAVVLTASMYADTPPWDGVPYAGDPKVILEAASKIDAHEDEGVVVLLDETRYGFDAGGRMQRTEYLVYRVTAESAVEAWSDIEVPWSPWYSEQPVVDARVITAAGTVYRLDPRSFNVTDAPDQPSMFTDTRVLHGPLPAVAAGAVVEQTIVWKEKGQIEGAGVVQRHDFGRWVASRNARLVIEHPAGISLKFVNRTQPVVEPVKSSEGGVTRIVYETGPLPARSAYEWNTPPDVSTSSYVSFSTGSSWQDVARRYSEIVDARIGSESLKKLTTSVVGGVKDPRGVAARILAKVEQDIRYAGVEFGEGSIIPRSPSETLAHKYGDCKDKAVLLVAMLREAGIPAHAALLVAGLGRDIDADLPGLGQFNHVIVAAGTAEDRFWIDPTDEFARAGELPIQDQGRLALIASPETTALVTTPVDDASVNRTVETREFFLAEDGKARVLETIEYFGESEREIRRSYDGSDEKAIKEGLEEYVKEGNFEAKALGKFSVSNARDVSVPFVIRTEALQSGRGITAGGEAAVGIFLSQLTTDIPWDLRPREDEEEEEADEPRKPRKHDYLFQTPHSREMRYRIHPPAGYTLRIEPKDETVTLGAMTVTKEYSVEPDGTVNATFRMVSGPRRMTAAQFEATREAVGKFEEEPALLVYFDQTGRRHLEAGEAGKAIEEFRRLIALHPKEALHHVEMANALLVAGLGTDARSEAARAVSLEPKSARAHAMLAKTLLHDAIGREFASGCDVPAAIASYRKAKELDPEDALIRAELAIVLQHDEKGHRYGRTAQLDAAIAEYEAMKSEVEANDDFIDRELMALLVRQKQWAKLKELTGTTTDTQKKDIFRLIAVTMLEGPAAAVESARSLDNGKRRDTLRQAASVLAVARQYPQAADLMEVAAQGAPDAATLRQSIEMFRKARRIEEIVPDPADPRSLFVRFFAAARMQSDFRSAMKEFVTEETFAVFDEEPEENAKSEKPEDEAMAAFYTDIGLAAIDIQQDGDEKTALRLRGRSPTKEAGDITLFVVREKDEWRIAAMNFSVAMLGLRALRAAEAGQIEQARQWLDWARDLVEGGGGDDPVDSNPFAAVWTRGRAADEPLVRVAAAMLLPETPQSAAIALPVLTAGRDGASDDVKWRIDQALAAAHQKTKNWPEVLAAADRLTERHPDSASAFELAVVALRQLDRHAEIRERAEARLARIREDAPALRVLASLSHEEGKHGAAREYYARVISSGDPTANDYNNYSWSALFAGAALDQAIEDGRRAVSLAPGHYPSLNTLAVIYAEQNRSSEARDMLLKSLAANDAELEGPDWYVVGRIAEIYGMRDSAVAAYRKVDKPEHPEATCWQLAQKRLAELAPKRK